VPEKNVTLTDRTVALAKAAEQVSAVIGSPIMVLRESAIFAYGTPS